MLKECAVVRAAFPRADAGCSLTAAAVQQTLVRTALQALAAFSAVRSLSTPIRSTKPVCAANGICGHDLLRTQQIIAHETGYRIRSIRWRVDFVRDADQRSERGAWTTFSQIDALGGMVAAIERRFPAARNRRGLLPLSARAGNKRN